MSFDIPQFPLHGSEPASLTQIKKGALAGSFSALPVFRGASTT